MYKHRVVAVGYSKSLLEAAKWLLETATKMNGNVPFMPWNTAHCCIQQIEYEWSPYYDDPETEEQMQAEIDLVPTPPKVGIKLTGRHASIMIEDIFHYSRIGIDDNVFSDSHIEDCQDVQTNEFIYAVSLAIKNLARTLGEDEVCMEIISFHDASAMQQDALTDWMTDRERYTKAGHSISRRRSRRYTQRRRRGGTAD